MRIFASPSRYIQGENALFENAKSILDLGIVLFYYAISWFMILLENDLKITYIGMVPYCSDAI